MNGRSLWIISPTIPQQAISSPERAACGSCDGDWRAGAQRGARVIYFHHDASMLLFALAAFAKNERADLSQQDRNDSWQLTTWLVEAFKRRTP